MGCFGVRIRVARAGARSRVLLLGTIQSGEASETIHQVRERFDWALRRQTEPIEGLNQSPKSLQSEQPQRAQAAVHLIEPLEKTLTNGERAKESSPSRILSFVWKLAVTADVEQVFASLAEETARMNVHSVVFDVRDHAAWVHLPLVSILGFPVTSSDFQNRWSLSLNSTMKAALKDGAGIEIFITASGRTSIKAAKPMSSALP